MAIVEQQEPKFGQKSKTAPHHNVSKSVNLKLPIGISSLPPTLLLYLIGVVIINSLSWHFNFSPEKLVCLKSKSCVLYLRKT